MRLFQHDETGRMCWSGPTLNPECFTEVPTMYEDELPEPMSDEEYAHWFANSKVVDGVRVGPRVTASDEVALWNTTAICITASTAKPTSA